MSYAESAGCFHCLEIFPAHQIREWTDLDNEEDKQTALCPKCEVDSVLPGGFGHELTPEFLVRMNEHWFKAKSVKPQSQ